MRLTGSEPHPGLLGSTVMQACQDVPCSGEVWPSGVRDVLNTRVFQQAQSRLRASNEATPPYSVLRSASGLRGLVHVCPDLLGSLADET